MTDLTSWRDTPARDVLRRAGSDRELMRVYPTLDAAVEAAREAEGSLHG